MLTKEQILAALTQAGVDPAMLTDQVLDAVVQALTAANPNPAPTDPNPVPPMDAKTFGDAIAKALAPLAQPKGLESLVTAAVLKATAPFAPAIDQMKRAAADAKANKIKAFGDKVTGGTAPVMTPVQFTAIKPLLEQADDVAVKTFGDGTAKTQGTALDEQIAALSAAYTVPVKTFGDRVPDPLKGNGKGSMTPERRAGLLGKVPEGEAVLNRERANAKK